MSDFKFHGWFCRCQWRRNVYLFQSICFFANTIFNYRVSMSLSC